MKLLQTTFIFVLLASISTSSNGQSIMRQSIGTIGQSAEVEEWTIQQSIGQVYNTSTFTDRNGDHNPGFIQPFVLIGDAQTHIKVTGSPNPAVDKIHFELSETLYNAQITVFDAMGRLVFNVELDEFDEYQLNCSTWQAGCYSVAITSQTSGVSTYYRFIKTH